MRIGLGIPQLAAGPDLRTFVQRAEQLGFESALVGDHIVLPTQGTRQYPYTADGSFSRAADEPFLETMTMLGYLAACTETIRLGSTVVILPYRNPVVQAKMFRLAGRADQRPHDLRRWRRLAGEGVRYPGGALRRAGPHERRVPGDIQSPLDPTGARVPRAVLPA